MNKHRIAVDVDDVLAAFTPYAHQFHKVPMDDKLDYWCERTMNEKMGVGWFSEKIAPVQEFWKTIPVLSRPEEIDFDIFCYMSSFPEQMVEARYQWLFNSGFPPAILICIQDKITECKRLGITHLIDDKPSTIQKLQDTDTIGIHFMAPYAGFEAVGDYVITNLNQVNKILNGTSVAI